MNVDLDRSESLTRRLLRLAGKLEPSPEPETIHQLRTTIRRLETLIHLAQQTSRKKHAKLSKQLAPLRRRAGVLRDIDVQIGHLREFRPDSATRDRARVLRELERRHTKRLRKVQSVVDKDFVKTLRRRLKRLQDDLRALPSTSAAPAGKAPSDPVRTALGRFKELLRTRRPLSEENLHDYRMQCKRLRYLAETGGETPDSKRVTVLFKTIQDAAGEWHDWLTLTQTAEEVLEGTGSLLLSSLRTATHARFVEGLQTIADAERNLLDLADPGSARKSPERALTTKPGMRVRGRAAATA